MNKPRDRKSPDDPVLDEMIDAARSDVPSDTQWDAARTRLHTLLSRKSGAADSSVRSPDRDRDRKAPGARRPAPRPAWRNVRLRPVALSFSALVLICALLMTLLLPTTSPTPAFAAGVTAGELRILAPDGQTTSTCPLRHTHVEANVTGFVSRTIVRQTFENPLPEKIEAVYVFPLPADSAVDSMVILIGDRRIVGSVKPREEARQVYTAARAEGKVAALLDQERPNIFTQSVANIAPGARVEVEISYVETLKLEDGFFEYSFPMVVAPRYIPGNPTGHSGSGVAPDTGRVPDASRISPPTRPPDTRAGHDIDVEVFLEAGSEIFETSSPLHEVEVERDSPSRAIVSLKNRKEIPNRDFILRYRTASDAVRDAFLSSTTPQGSFFLLALQPPRRVTPEQARPKEMIFVIDRSGSMSGNPIEKAKETMRLCIESMNPRDTFNLLSFAGGTGRCFSAPQPNTPENRVAALQYLNDLQGSGGTEMMPAILESLGRPADPDRVRIVCFVTDGEIGNDGEIIAAVKKNVATSRVFSFGIGNSTNRYLLDAMAREGRGEVQYVTLTERGSEAAQKFRNRIDSPVLTDIYLDWNGLPVTDVYPSLIPDLFAEKPILITGRLNGPAKGTVILRGNTAAGAFERRIALTESTGPERRDAIGTMWARAKVGALMRPRDSGSRADEVETTFTNPTQIRDEITSLGVQFGLMTPYTSFVAVEETPSTPAGDPHQVAVPVEMPDGQTNVDRGPGQPSLVLQTGRGANHSHAFVYDPTNGTVSEGDVWRVDQGPRSSRKLERNYGLISVSGQASPGGVVTSQATQQPHISTRFAPVHTNAPRNQSPLPAGARQLASGTPPATADRVMSFYANDQPPPASAVVPQATVPSSPPHTWLPTQSNSVQRSPLSIGGTGVPPASPSPSAALSIPMEAKLSIPTEAQIDYDRDGDLDLSFANGNASAYGTRSAAESAPVLLPATSPAPGQTGPVVTPLPDITIGDKEDPASPDTNFFVYTNAFRFDDHVVDTTPSQLSPVPLTWNFAGTSSPAPAARVPRKTWNESATSAAVTRSTDALTSDPLQKLAPELRGLETRLDAEGNLTTGPVTVQRYMAEIRVHLVPGTPGAEAGLRAHGFEPSGPADANHAITGRMDVRKLRELAALDAVARITAPR